MRKRMKRYYLTGKTKPVAETQYDAQGNIIIPEQYIIKEIDDNKTRWRKNYRWRLWQKCRQIEPVTDLPGFVHQRGRYKPEIEEGEWYIRQRAEFANLSDERKNQARSAQDLRIAALQERIAALQEQRTNATGAAFDDLTTQINILRCKIEQTRLPVYRCKEANPHYY